MNLESAQIIFLLLLLAIIALATLAAKLDTPYPIVLVIGGLLLGFVPRMPPVPLNPDLVFLIFLPPLLYAVAWNTSWTDFLQNIAIITILAVGLVAFTVGAVAVCAPLLFPGFDWRVGFVLGAVVATTDAIAATTMAKRLGLPKRIVDILEGESLINDATGLLALQFGTTILVYGETPSVISGVARLAYLSVAGIAVGLAIAKVVEWFELAIDNAPIEIAISIFVPYAAYLAGELIHASGVLSVIAAGLFLGRRSFRFFSPSVRLQANAAWSALVFILNGLVFILIGLQLRYVLNEIAGFGRVQLFLYAAVFCAFLILLRLAWTYPGAWLAHMVSTRLLGQRDETPPGGRLVFVLGWTGMRGVIALAAAISLPGTLANGGAFPQRSLIVFLTFSVILVTLVVQGLTLPAVIRALRLAGSKSAECEEDEARSLMIEAALAYLEENRGKDDPAFAEIYDDLAQHYRRLLSSLKCIPENVGQSSPEHYSRYLEVSRDVLNVERQASLRLRREGRISDEVLRDIEHELDLNAVRLVAAEQRGR